MNISGFADALKDCDLAKPVLRQPDRPPLQCQFAASAEPAPPPEPLTFVVHRVNGVLSPALYHGDKKIGCRDPIVLEQRIDTLPNAAELCTRPLGELMFESWARFQALDELGALPERVGPPTPRSAA